MTTTPKLGIPLISSQQSQPEVTHNQMVVLLQALAGGAIDERNAPPGSPAAGDCYIIGGAPSGLWAGHNHAIAIYYGGWNFVPGFDDDGVVIPMTAAQNGLSIFNNDTGELWAWQTSSWIVVTGGTGASRLIDLLDVSVSETSSENGDYLVWHDPSGTWRNQNPPRLVDLSDVAASETSTIDGDFLAWDDASGKWVPRPISIPSDGVPALKDLSDVAVGDTSTQDGDFLVWDDSVGKWVAMPISFPSDGVPPLSSLPDVSIVSPVDGDVLKYNGVTHKWEAEPDEVGTSGDGPAVDGTTIISTLGVLSALLPSSRAFLYTKATDFALADAVVTKVVLPTAVFSSVGAAYSTVTGRFTADRAGKYLFFATAIGQVATAMNQTALWLAKNGLIGGGGTVLAVCSAAQATSFSAQKSGSALVLTIVDMNGTTDFVEFDAFVAGTGGSNVLTATNGFFGGMFIGP